MNPDHIANLRLSAQRIAQADFVQAEDVVRHLLAMQAQDYAGGLWSIGLRTKRCTITDVERAIQERRIVRTWPMRGTLHFLHADDARWMVKLLAHRATTSARTRRLRLGLTDVVMSEVENVLRTELAGGKIIRRDELMKTLRTQVHGVKIEHEQFGHILRNFGERAVLCFGPHDGKQPTFVLMDDWLPPTPDKDRDTALGELARRYFMSHGPASLKDLAGWAGITMSDARAGLERIENALEAKIVSGITYYFAPNLQPADTPSAFLLPGFDEYMLGYKDRSAALAVEHSNKIVPGGNGMFLSTIVLDGQIAGTWKRNIKKTGITFEHLRFDGAVMPMQLLDGATGRYEKFMKDQA